MKLCLLACLLAIASSAASESATKPTKKAAPKAAVKAAAQLRLEMLKWYCAEGSGHAEERPCKTYGFMQKRLNAKDAEEKKKVDEERKAATPTDEAGKRQFGIETRQGYVKMYTSYCAQTPPPNPAICSDVLLKQTAERFAKQQSAKDKKAAAAAPGVLSDKAASPA